jgi:23S rRNA (guanine2445-N2)-methyltransferase / 23S rRNA (guanine2069-N7)-methyltransferase
VVCPARALSSNFDSDERVMTKLLEFFATVPKNMELLLAEELERLGAQQVKQTVAGVHFQGSMEVGYRAVLWSRLANTILLPIARFEAGSPEQLYAGVGRIAWDEYLSVGGTLAVTFTSSRSQITHTKYGSLKVKDAIVDQFRERYDARPSVDLERPDVRINCHVDKDEATVSIDLAGDSLHRRAYREDWGKAPIKENVAAAVLLRAGWPEMALKGGTLVDPMCGSGTLLIEGAMMAADHAPGLLRDYFGFLRWAGHEEALWASVVEEANERLKRGMESLRRSYGFDISGKAVGMARQNAENAGYGDHIEFRKGAVKDLVPPGDGSGFGLVVANAPYGERLGDDEEAVALHREFGQVLKDRFGGWSASVLTGSRELAQELRLRPDKRYTLYNGRLECVLLNYRLREDFYSP